MDEFSKDFAKILVVTSENKGNSEVLGFIVLHIVKGAFETQVIELVVRPNMRRKKIATRLLDAVSAIDPNNEVVLYAKD